MAERPTKAKAMSAADWINTHTTYRANNVTADWPSMKDKGWWFLTRNGNSRNYYTDNQLCALAYYLGWKNNDTA